MVERFRNDGALVATCGRGERPDLPDDVLWVRADVADPAATDGLVAQVEAELGPVAVLVSNAGVQVERTVADSTDDDWELVVGTDCRGVSNLCRAVLPGMSERGGVRDRSVPHRRRQADEQLAPAPHALLTARLGAPCPPLGAGYVSTKDVRRLEESG